MTKTPCPPTRPYPIINPSPPGPTPAIQGHHPRNGRRIMETQFSQTQATNPATFQPTPQTENADKNPKLDSYDAADNAYNFRYKKSRRSYASVRKIAAHPRHCGESRNPGGSPKTSLSLDAHPRHSDRPPHVIPTEGRNPKHLSPSPPPHVIPVLIPCHSDRREESRDPHARQASQITPKSPLRKDVTHVTV